MPFTLVHPAAVLPLTRTPLVPSALVLGSMAPDLPYYVSLVWIGGDYNLTLTHSPSSLLWLDPVIALVLLAVFHLVLERPLVALLPRAAAERVWPAVQRSTWRRAGAAGWVVLSCALGAATHLAWDALTEVFGYSSASVLNLASSALGGVVLLGWAWRRWRTTSPEPIPPDLLLAAWQRNVVLGVVLALAVLAGAVDAVNSAREAQDALGDDGTGSLTAVIEYALRAFVVGAVTALGVAAGVYAVGWHLSAIWHAQRAGKLQT